MTKLEAVDDSSDPLGPLGDKSFPPIPEQGPIPPQKESFAARNLRPTSSASQSSSATGLMESVDLEDDEARPRMRPPPPVQPPSTSVEGPKRTQPSMTVEQASKPTFNITVGDPHKVGDLTSSHIVYQVRTKVCALLVYFLRLASDISCRQLQKHICNQNLPLLDDIATSYGYIMLYTTITQD